MEMIIDDITTGEKRIINPKYIPRIGEKIATGKYPTPIVTDVIYDFDNEKVLVIINVILR